MMRLKVVSLEDLFFKHFIPFLASFIQFLSFFFITFVLLRSFLLSLFICSFVVHIPCKFLFDRISWHENCSQKLFLLLLPIRHKLKVINRKKGHKIYQTCLTSCLLLFTSSTTFGYYFPLPNFADCFKPKTTNIH